MLDTTIMFIILAALVIYLVYLVTKGNEAQVKKFGIRAKSIRQETEDNERVLKKRMADLKEFEVWLYKEMPTFHSIAKASIMSGCNSVVTSFYDGNVRFKAKYNTEKEKVFYTYINMLTNTTETFETFDKFQEFYYINRKNMLSSIKKDMVSKDFE